MSSFHSIAGGRRTVAASARGKIVVRGRIFTDVTLTVRVEAVVFFAVLAILVDVLIMPWALDSHPLERVAGAEELAHVTRHASAIVTQLGTAVLILAVIVATLAHELGHALALRRAGATEVEIVVYGAGGACRAQARDTSPLALIWYAAAGPLVTNAIVIGLVCTRMLVPWPHTVRALMWLVAAVQAGTLLLNLLPVFKRSDGGHILSGMSDLLGGSAFARGVVAIGLCCISGALLATLQGSSVAALLCCALTVLLSALLAAAAWRLDARASKGAHHDRPASAPKAIAFW